MNSEVPYFFFIESHFEFVKLKTIFTIFKLKNISSFRFRNSSKTEEDCDSLGVLEPGGIQQEGEEKEEDPDVGVGHLPLVDGLQQVGRRKDEINYRIILAPRHSA